MGDIKLFQLANGSVIKLSGKSVAIEKSLQSLVERHLEEFLGVRFLASEHPTGRVHGGRIDTLGIDENSCPVIIEYKRSINENVINQGLYYFDWLMDHKAEFKLLVMDRLGPEEAGKIEWAAPRLVCIAGDFTKYDVHAVQQINRNIELMRYQRFGDDLLLLELVNATTGQISSADSSKSAGKAKYKTFSELFEQGTDELHDRFEALKAFLVALGDDVQVKTLQFYVAFKRINNFACVEVRPTDSRLLVFVKVAPDTIECEPGFTRDVRNIGHFGTGDLEITITNEEQFEKAKPLLIASYEAN